MLVLITPLLEEVHRPLHQPRIRDRPQAKGLPRARELERVRQGVAEAPPVQAQAAAMAGREAELEALADKRLRLARAPKRSGAGRPLKRQKLR